MNASSSLPINVVLLPNSELAQKAIAASRRLTHLDGFFTLKDGEYFPHASLYMLQLGRVKEACNALMSIASKTEVFKLTADHYEVHPEQHYIDIEYIKFAELSALQSRMLEALNPLRDGMRAKDMSRMQEATGLARENYEKYGWNSIGDLYRPHLTLTQFQDAQPSALELLPDITKFSGLFDAIGIFEMGDHGTCIRKIAAFPLLKATQGY